MTTYNNENINNDCPAEKLLKELSGKWKPQILLLASTSPVRFNSLMRQLEGVNKQSLAKALREMEQENIIIKNVISQKPLHIEYSLTEKGIQMIGLLKKIEGLSK